MDHGVQYSNTVEVPQLRFQNTACSDHVYQSRVCCSPRAYRIGYESWPRSPCFAAAPLVQIPIAVVVTKIDICPPTVLKQTRQALAKYLRQNQKMPYPIKDVSQARTVLTFYPGIQRGKPLPTRMSPMSWASIL